MVETFQDKLGLLLQEAGFITSSQLDQASKITNTSGRRLTDVLLEQKFISREVLITALSFYLKVPVVNLREIKIEPEVLEFIPKEFAHKHEVLPVALGLEGELRVVMEEPNDFGLINTLSTLTRRTIRPALSLDIRVKDMVDTVYSK